MAGVTPPTPALPVAVPDKPEEGEVAAEEGEIEGAVAPAAGQEPGAARQK